MVKVALVISLVFDPICQWLLLFFFSFVALVFCHLYLHFLYFWITLETFPGLVLTCLAISTSVNRNKCKYILSNFHLFENLGQCLFATLDNMTKKCISSKNLTIKNSCYRVLHLNFVSSVICNNFRHLLFLFLRIGLCFSL